MKKIAAKFFKTSSGREPVRDWLLSLTKDERKKIGEDIGTAEYGWPIGMPTCRKLGDGLNEIRTEVADKWARVFFCVKDSFMVLLHGIMKKGNKTPKKDLDLAKSRMKELLKK